MKRRLSKSLIRCIVVGLILFMVGFFVAKLITPTQAGEGSSSSSGESGFKKEIETRNSDFRIILGSLLFISAIVTYGYIKEKRRRKVDK
jgi:NADH:ubiquinone oxidoreductase subunit 3 (subunit A)